MKTVIISNSKYGYTEKYAYWLAEEVNAELL
jgi:flavodoxin